MSEIKKRRLGKTDLMVTELGLGAMDTSQVPEGEETLNAALDLGINFIDTGREYEGSEYLLGQVIRARSAKDLNISTKTMSRGINAAQHDIDRSLSILGVDRISVYHLHDVSTPEAWDQVMAEDGALNGLKVAQYRGLIDHIAVSTHSLEILERAITCGEFGAVMLEYSAFYRDSERLISLAKQEDVGVIVMRPLGGSGRTSAIRNRMSEPGVEVFLTPAMLLRYVLSNPDISVAIPGARYPDRIRSNVEVASSYEPLSESEMEECEREAGELFA